MKLLDQFSEDLLLKAASMDPVIGREKEIETVIGILSRKNKNNPALIGEAAKRYGDQCVVLSVDVKRVDGVFRVFAKGGRENTGMEAIEWIKRCVGMGAGEIVVNSIDTDGVKGGFDIELLRAVCDTVNVPVIASGGAGSIRHFVELFRQIPTIDAGLAASIFHFGEVAIPDLKRTLRDNDIIVRL